MGLTIAASGGNSYAHGIYPISGRYIAPQSVHGAAGTRQLTDQVLELMPFVLAKATTFDRVGIFISGAASAGGTLRCGLYADSSGVPGAKLQDSGTVAATGTGDTTITVSWTLAPGRYWYGLVAQGASVTQPTVRTFSTGLSGLDYARSTLEGYRSSGLGIQDSGVGIYTYAVGTGALPSTLGAVTYAAPNLAPQMVGLRAA